MVAAKKPDLVVFIPGGGGLPYKSDGDARLLTLGCKLQILVSLRQGVWEGKLLYLPIQVSLRAVLKEIYKKCLDTDHTEMVSLRGLI